MNSNNSRREFLKRLGIYSGAGLASSIEFPNLMSQWVRNAGFIPSAQASGGTPTYFIEINLRDQWDFGHVMVAPGLATLSELKRGATGDLCAMFYDIEKLKRIQGANHQDLFLTPDSLSLEPHLENIALLELCELSLGNVHGHEAANAIRSPGRSYNKGPGRTPMWLLDPRAKTDGNDNHYSSSPTPAVLHNHYNLTNFPSRRVRQGVAFKGISRAIHTVYHHSADLMNCQLERYQSQDDIVRAFKSAVPLDWLTLMLSKDPEMILNLIEEADMANLIEQGYTQADLVEYARGKAATLVDLRESSSLPVLDISLTAEEIAYWGEGVPAQRGETIKAQIWEQCAYAFKLIQADMVRTIALEFDFVDVHGSRSQDQMEVQGKQTSLPLTRLIESLKRAGLFERTLIAMYTTDGGRSPAADSYGSSGKNGAILAGGMIRGGYYGNITVDSTNERGHSYAYHRPDENGVAIEKGVTDNSGRVAGADLWVTVARALGMNESLYRNFPDTKEAKVLNYLLRT